MANLKLFNQKIKIYLFINYYYHFYLKYLFSNIKIVFNSSN